MMTLAGRARGQDTTGCYNGSCISCHLWPDLLSSSLSSPNGLEMVERMIGHFADISSTKPSPSNHAEEETPVLKAICTHT